MSKALGHTGTTKIGRRSFLAATAVAGGFVGIHGLCPLCTRAYAQEESDLRGTRMCTQMLLPDRFAREAVEIAEKANPENRLLPGYLESVAPEQPPASLEIAALWQKKWQNGSTLRVGFLDRDAEVEKKIEHYAHQWSEFASLKFDFGGSSPEIRIGLRPGGSWSYLGTDALHPSLEGTPTMNFGWLTPQTADDEYSRVVLHEFGHALGAIHEHQHPDSGIPWNKETVYEYYKQTQGWSKDQVEENIFRTYNRSWLQYGIYDKESIMHYAISKELTDGTFEVAWNRQLSPLDKQVISRVYPKPT